MTPHVIVNLAAWSFVVGAASYALFAWTYVLRGSQRAPKGVRR